ncbi:MAG: ATP synthase subunit I [Desulfobacterales bacterium]|nr:MAG: ATP synthase subunit I [Desulfobacterales bacterium]
METLRQIQKKYCSTAITVAIFGALLFIFADQKAIGKGLVLGSVFSIVNFILMGETLPRRLGKSKGKTFMWALGSIYFRYIILAIPLIMAIKMDQLNLFAAIVGIFLVQIVILADHALKIIFSTREKQV